MLFKQKHVTIIFVKVLIIFVLFAMATITLAQEDSWITKSPMPTPRAFLSTSVVDGKIYALGGRQSSGSSALFTVEQYDPETGTWTEKEAMFSARQWPASSAVNGKIYVFGGSPNTYEPALATVEEYDPTTDTWTEKTNMPTARFTLSASVVDGLIYVIGGITRSTSHGIETPSDVVEAYDPATDTWVTKEPMLTARGTLATCVVNGKIYAIGGALGAGQSGLKTVEMYDPVTDTWTKKADMPTGIVTYSAVSTVKGIIYVIGGYSNQVIETVEAYDPATDIWTSRTSMPTARAFLSTSVVNEKIYAIGGTIESPWDGISTVEEYTPPGVTSVENPFCEHSSPTEFMLKQNYPNPFNPKTVIGYALPKAYEVELSVYNSLGQKVSTLVNKHQNAGNYKIDFDATNLSSGIYIYNLHGDGVDISKKMIVMK